MFEHHRIWIRYTHLIPFSGILFLLQIQIHIRETFLGWRIRIQYEYRNIKTFGENSTCIYSRAHGTQRKEGIKILRKKNERKGTENRQKEREKRLWRTRKIQRPTDRPKHRGRKVEKADGPQQKGTQMHARTHACGHTGMRARARVRARWWRYKHPKDPSVLKRVRPSNPYCFAIAVVFQDPYRFPASFS